MAAPQGEIKVPELPDAKAPPPALPPTPKRPKLELPKLSLPKVKLPSLKLPKLADIKAKLAGIKLPKLKLPDLKLRKPEIPKDKIPKLDKKAHADQAAADKANAEKRAKLEALNREQRLQALRERSAHLAGLAWSTWQATDHPEPRRVAYHLGVLALEHGVQAAILKASGDVPENDPAWHFGRHLRDVAGPDATRLVNQILGNPEMPRPPEDAPAPPDAEERMRFVHDFHVRLLPALLEGKPA